MLWELIKQSADGKSFDIQTNFLNQFFKEMNGDQFGEFAFGYWGLKGYKNLFSLKLNFWNLWKTSVHLSKDKSTFRIFFGEKAALSL